jgi:hypothetical protein
VQRYRSDKLHGHFQYDFSNGIHQCACDDGVHPWYNPDHPGDELGTGNFVDAGYNYCTNNQNNDYYGYSAIDNAVAYHVNDIYDTDIYANHIYINDLDLTDHYGTRINIDSANHSDRPYPKRRFGHHTELRLQPDRLNYTCRNYCNLEKPRRG